MTTHQQAVDAAITSREELFDLMKSVAGCGHIGVVINRMIDAMEDAEIVKYKEAKDDSASQ